MQDAAAAERDDVQRLARIVAAAARSSLPRITRENAASYPVPHDLRKLKGARNSIERNDDGGSCVLWFWQMTGKAWDLKGLPQVRRS